MHQEQIQYDVAVLSCEFSEEVSLAWITYIMYYLRNSFYYVLYYTVHFLNTKLIGEPYILHRTSKIKNSLMNT